jgi:putative ABC transport system permease protein
MRFKVLQYRESFIIAMQSLALHKTRSLLTMLGIIFGVGAVIAMLSIGEGAKQESLEQIEVLGVRNIIVRSLEDSESEDQEGDHQSRPMGISIKDADAIREICPFVTAATVTWENKVEARTYDGSTKTTLIGTTPEYLTIFNVRLGEGTFLLPHHLASTSNVCVIGSEIRHELFGFRNPVNQLIKLQGQWFTVIGVMETKNVSKTADIKVAMSNSTIIVPLTTAMAKYPREFKSTASVFFGRGRRFRVSRNEQQYVDRSTIDQIAVQVDERTSITEAARVISGILKHRHNDQEDFTITIPEQLIEQQQKTQSIFNIVMGAIAGISLLVGGIGIMNIMLASVLERTREIGVRRAIGATKMMVVVQFLSEAVLLSVLGGVAGIFVGWGLTEAITAYAGWRTIVNAWSILLAFSVAAATGIVFGYYPAKQAAEKDVIDALRYE